MTRRPGSPLVGPLGVVVAGLALAVAGPAHAAFPGRDGLIAFGSQSSAQSLLTMSASGAGLEPLTTCRQGVDEPCGGTQPAWSPDGRRIAFVRGSELWVMDADGTDARALEGVRGTEPAWAPDGRRLVFTSDGYRGRFGLAIVKADGSSGRTLTTLGRDSSPAWSPDGRRIAFTRFRDDGAGGQDIYTIAPSGKARKRLISGCFCTSPDYSPDGRHIAYDAGSTAQVHTATADGKNRRRLTSAIGAVPAWSPSGRFIAFARGDELYLMNRDGSRQRRIGYRRKSAPKFDREARWDDPAWQPSR